MKKPLLALCALLFCTIRLANAQNYTYGMDSLLQHLDKSVITTGVLYDRALPLAGVHMMNSTRPDTSSRAHFLQAYLEMYNSAYNHASWPLPDTIKNRAVKQVIIHNVPVGLSFYTYNLIDTNAEVNNLIAMHSDSLYYDVPGRIRSPYYILNTFIASPIIDSVDGHGVLTFSFPSNLFINKSTLTMSSLKVDFNDGIGLVNVSLNTNYTIKYNLPNGFRSLKFVMTMSNGIVYTTYGRVKVYHINLPIIMVTKAATTMATATSCDPQTYFTIQNTGTFQGYDETSATSGYGEAQIYYATNACDGVLRKPIIVMDGFDPGDGNSISNIYDQLNVNYQGQKYADYLRSIGYDIVILNFPEYNMPNGAIRDGGADYIERNAQVLISLIDQINAMHPTSKLILMGPSMGGLISRYALAYMEQHQHVHNVKLWISFDSPHNGANIPLGDQQFLNFHKGDNATAKEALDKSINSPAAKQMLINHYLANLSGPGGAPGFRDRFVTAMNAIGFPAGDPGQVFRKIALIDGSLGGNELHAGGQQGFYFDVRAIADIHIWFIRKRLYGATVSFAQMNFTPNAGSSGTVLRASQLLFKAKVSNFTTPSYTSGYDTAPGGTTTTQATISQANNQVLWQYGLKFLAAFHSVIPDHSFINTKSALAFRGSNQNLSENLSARNLVCTNETPFNSYFGSFTANSVHVSLSPASTDWLHQEILGNPQAPSVVTQSTSYTINGPTDFCSSAVYSVANLPAGATVTWSATPANAVTLTPTGQQVTVTKLLTSSVTLSAYILNNCLVSKATTTFHEGGPYVPTVGVFLKNMNGYYNIIFSTAYVAGQTYQWTINGYSQGTGSSCSVRASDCSGGPVLAIYDVQVTVGNSCGTNTACQEFKFGCDPYPNIVANGICGGGGGGGALALASVPASKLQLNYYPNPTSQILTLTENASTQATDSTTPYSYKIYDKKGKIWRQGSSNGSDITINLGDLPNDTYFLHTTMEGILSEKQIIVNH